ncbi:MAG: hemolysin family protein [Acidimicrobiia bacterium]|nr:hemolysin family protein [Acidimicrobiia bacterium]
MTALLVLSLALVLVGGWVRAAGTAVATIPRADALRDESDGIDGAGVVAALLDEREAITPAIGLVASACLVFGAVIAASVLLSGRSLSSALAIGLIVAFTVTIVGDIVPRGIGRASGPSVAYRSSRLLNVAVRIGSWANALFPPPETKQETDSPESLEETDEHERELIDSVLGFSETIVREVMTPRPDMTTIPVTSSIEELIDIASDAGYSRVPVTSNGDIVGHVIVKDLLSMLTDASRPASVAEVMRPIDFVPETKLASVLLGEMQESHAHQVIVVDEFGDVVGLVTIEDLLEELVGEIADETDDEEMMIHPTPSGWHVDGRLPVGDLVKVTGVELPDDEWDTVGGLVLGLAERVPEEGEEFEFQELVLSVRKMQGRRVSEVGVRRAQPEAV